MAVKIRLPEFGTSWIVRAVVGGVALVVVLILYQTTTTYVKPGEFAVRQIYFGPGQGMQTDRIGPGLHLIIPGYERLHVLPRTLQLLASSGAWRGSLNIGVSRTGS